MFNAKIDFSRNDGIIKPMNAVNNGPSGPSVRGLSNFQYYKDAKIPYARLHDSSFFDPYGGEWTVDVHRIFRNFDADENDEKNYNFKPTDDYLKTIVDAGTKIFYRLGASIEHHVHFGTRKPNDYLKWARICEHIIRHYNEGWADGFHYDIEYWEIWNEFDCTNPDGSNPCWQGTYEEFAEFFSATARYLKKKFPSLKIGGPAFAGILRENGTTPFFERMKKDHVPMDFISYHTYRKDIEEFRSRIEKANELFKKYGYENSETIIDEWNYISGWLGDKWKNSLKAERGLKGAAFIASCMEVSQGCDVDMLMYYDARPNCSMNGMFDYLYEPIKGYYPFKMFSYLKELGTYIRAENSIDDVYIAAAKGKSGYGIMMSYYNDDENLREKNIKIQIENSSLYDSYDVEYYLLDEDNDCDLVKSETVSGKNFMIDVNMKIYDTYYIKITGKR